MAETLVVVPVDGTISEMRQWGHSHRDYPSEDSRNKALQLIENLSAHTDKVINSDVDLRFSKVLNEAMVLALDKLLELHFMRVCAKCTYPQETRRPKNGCGALLSLKVLQVRRARSLSYRPRRTAHPQR